MGISSPTSPIFLNYLVNSIMIKMLALFIAMSAISTVIIATPAGDAALLAAVDGIKSILENLSDGTFEVADGTASTAENLKKMDDAIKDEIKELKQLVEDETDDLKYMLNIVLGKLDKILFKSYGPKFGPKYGPKFGPGYKHGGYGPKYGPRKYGYGNGYGKKLW